MTRDQILGFFAGHLTAVNDHDLDGIGALYAEDCALTSPLAGTQSGRAAIQHLYDTWLKASPDLVMTIDETVIDGDHVVEIGSAHGTDSGGFMGFPPTGRRFSFPMMLFYQLQGREIVRFRTIYDFTGVLVQLGVLKARPV